MPNYILLVNLTENGRKTVRDNPHRVEEVNAEMESMGVKVKDQYALLGPYDFISVVEAKDEAVLTKALIQFASRGTASSVTLPAIPTAEWVKRLGG
jgi:uncharacterized protein with GYD domain